MKSDEKLWKIVMDIWRESYKKAEPSVNLDKLMMNGTTKKDQWFMDYYLPDVEYQKIINKHLKKNNITAMEKKRMLFEIYLGAGPTGVKKSDRLRKLQGNPDKP